MLFKALGNDIFAGCHVEAYSFWVKKRVLVFEYGRSGKLKLGVESLDEQAALLDFTVGSCAFERQCVAGTDALFLYANKQSAVLTLAPVFVVPGSGQESVKQAVELKRCMEQRLNMPLQFRLLYVARETDEQVRQTLADAYGDVLFLPYDNYIGRSIEDFVKK